MALPIWPTDLPKYFEASTLNVVALPNRIVSSTEVGPTRSRRRSTLQIYRVTGNLFLNATQRDLLLDFYDNSATDTPAGVSGGVQRFTWHHPWDETRSVTMKFLGDSAPSINARGSLVFVASLTLEMTEP